MNIQNISVRGALASFVQTIFRVGIIGVALFCGTAALADNAPPVVTFTGPADNQTYYGASGPVNYLNLVLNAQASDSDGEITQVQFYRGTTLIGNAGRSSGSASNGNWNLQFAAPLTSVGIVNYEIFAKATDDSGAVTTSAPLHITVVSNQAPQGYIYLPFSPYTAPLPPSGTGNLVIKVTAWDGDTPISQIQLYSGTTLVGSVTTNGTDMSNTWDVTWPNVSAGTYQITAKVTDSLGGSVTTQPVTVIAVNNQVPSIGMTAPTSGQSFFSGVGGAATVQLTATASDSDGQVAQVKFYQNGNLIGTGGTLASGTASNGVWSQTFSPIYPGTHTFSAQATDNLGIVSAITSPVTITVTQAALPVVDFSNYPPYVSPTVGIQSGNTVVPIRVKASSANAEVSQIELMGLPYGAVLGPKTLISGTTSNGVWQINWTNAVSGGYSLTAKVTDSLAQTRFSQYLPNGAIYLIVVDDYPPVITVTTPTNNTTVPGSLYNVSVPFSATGSDQDGTISNMIAYKNGDYVQVLNITSGTSSNGAWSNVVGLGVGTHTMTVVATDNQGVQTTSAPITLTVSPPVAPTVTLNAPSGSLNPPANLVLSVTVVDSIASYCVAFFEGANYLGNGTRVSGTDQNGVWTFNWSNVPAGVYSIKAIAACSGSGLEGNSQTLSVTVGNNVAPTVSITAPTSGATVTAPATFALTAIAADSDGTVSQVQFFNGATLLGSATMTSGNASSGSYVYNWSNVPAGTYTVTAVATDSGGAATTSGSISVISQANVAPTVSITAPTSGATVTAPAGFTLTATAADSDGTVSQVQFFSDSTLIGTGMLASGNASSGSYVYNWSSIPAGTYTITAVATDNLGQTTTSSGIAATVQANPQPAVIITLPVSGASFTAPAGIALTASASAGNSGTISGVQFYNGSTLIGVGTLSSGNSTAGTYSFNWNNVPTGTYLVTSQLSTSSGQVALSPVLTILVSPAPGMCR